MTTFFDAWHFDGQSAVRRKVEIQTIGKQFYLLEREMRHGPFHFEDLRFLEAKGDDKIYGLSVKDGWRLGMTGSVPAELSAMRKDDSSAWRSLAASYSAFSLRSPFSRASAIAAEIFFLPVVFNSTSSSRISSRLSRVKN